MVINELDIFSSETAYHFLNVYTSDTSVSTEKMLDEFESQ